MVLKITKSNEKSKPLKPQIEIFNEGRFNQYVNGIELTFDSYFTLFGTVEIIIGDMKILYGNEAEDFKQYRVFPVPVNSQILKPYESIKIFVWNPQTDDIVTLSANIDLHDEPAVSTLSGQAIDNDTILSEISGGAGDDSDTHDIFPFQIYQDTTKEFLINTKGRNNMILTMAATTVEPPVILSNLFPVDTTPDPLEIQNIRTSYQPTTGAGSWFRQSYELRCDNVPAYVEYTTQYLLIDYLNTDRKDIIFSLMSDTPTVIEYIYNYLSAYYTDGRVDTNYTYTDLSFLILNSITHSVEASDDINFVTGVIQLGNYDFTGIKVTKQYSSVYKRYIRIREIILCSMPSPNNQTLTQITPSNSLDFTSPEQTMKATNYYDELTHGGTASVKFQLKGVNEQWFTILDSTELDSLTNGASKLIRYSIEGVPASQSRFKAVLEVQGSLKTGVTIDLVS